MSKLTWDDTGKRKYETGVSNGVLYVKNASEGGYSEGVAWNGLINITEKPSGAEPSEIWADNMKYAVMRSAEKFGASIKAYTYPDAWKACDGTASVVEGFSIGQQVRAPFGLCYKTLVGSDEKQADGSEYKIHIIYNATASPSEKSRDTVNDSPAAAEMSWEVDTTPVVVTGFKPTSHVTLDSATLGADAMKAIEDKLYGTDSAGAPTLPSIDELKKIIEDAKAAKASKASVQA